MNPKELKIYRQHLAIQMKHTEAMHRELGEFYGYPSCCIDQFCKEVNFGIMSAFHREITHKRPLPSGIQYVPCDECMKKMGMVSPFHSVVRQE